MLFLSLLLCVFESCMCKERRGRGGGGVGGWGWHSGLAALASCSERLETVHRVGMYFGFVEMVPGHHCPHRE